MADAFTGIQKYKALRDYLVSVHGIVGQSRTTGANLPRMTYADRWIFGGIFMGVTLAAIKAHVRPDAYNVPHNVTAVDSASGFVLAADREHGTLVPGAGGISINGESLPAITRKRPLVEWLAGKQLTGSQNKFARTPDGEAFPWYAWPFAITSDEGGNRTTDRVAVESILAVWERLWNEIKAPKTSTSVYLSLDETESLFAALYAFVTTIPATYIPISVGSPQQLWEDAQNAGRAAVKQGSAAVKEVVKTGGEIAADALNFAGDAAGGALSKFLQNIGWYGVAVLVGLFVAHKYGVV